VNLVQLIVPGRITAGALVKGEPVTLGAPWTPGAPPAGPSAEELQQLTEEARQQAQQQLQQQSEELRAETRSAVDALEAALGEAHELREQILAEAEEQLVDLAVDIARKVLAQEIEAGRYEIEPIVSEALKRVPARRDVVVHLHPEDHARCMEARGEKPADEHVTYKADPSVARAGCVLETDEGVIDSAVEPHLEDIREALKGLE
jgi:flagellar assembly protein FliH